MTKKDAVRILMLSPVYFRLSLPERSELLRHFYLKHQVSEFPAPWLKTDQKTTDTKPNAWH